MENLNIQLIEPQDIEYISKNINTLFKCSWDELQFSQDAYSCSSKMYVAKYNDEIVGFISYKNMYDQLEIMNICVNINYRNLGIGKKLMQIVFNDLHTLHLDQIMLEVNVNNSFAIKLYEDLGFKVSSIRKDYYLNKDTNVKEDAYIMIFKEENV